jgi:tRNA threonylcarbamoyladenosine biosynthesis protein TsaB
MKLLAVDTASQSCGVALVEKDRLLAEMLLVSRETHSVHLMGMIREVSTRSKVPLASVDGFAVSLGPGSFTGLRIGISTLKGLAAALEKPLVGVSTLEALAWQHPLPGSSVVVLMDARRREVYAARFRFDSGSLVRETPDQVRDPMAVIGEVAGPCLFVGSGALLHRDHITAALGEKARFVPEVQNHLRPSSVASLGWRRLAEGKTASLENLRPIYIRKSDAEIHRTPAAGRLA